MREESARSRLYLCALAALVMAFGWGYRGITGHEGGAMVPGAMLGLALCVGTARPDWHRRAAVAGLFGAVGWAWGGSFSYMEQTFYTVSDSFWDVFYGYAMLFFLGALWAGIGGAILGLACTLPRSRLERLAAPFTSVCAVFLLIHGYFLLFPGQERELEGWLSAVFPTSGEGLSATVILAVGVLHALARPRERNEALLFAGCALAWWIGYLALVWLGGLALGPPYRSESWGGGVAVLLVLFYYLHRERNFAALLLARHGLLAGGLGFALAVFVRHPVRVEWGPFAPWQGTMQWKIAEESFGFFMGLGLALGVLRLVRGKLAPALEDVPPTRLDVFSVFVILVGILWVNLRRAPERWMDRYELLPNTPIAGLMPWTWFTFGGLALSAVAVCALYLYARGRLFLLPDQPYAKGVLLLLLLLWIIAVGGFVQHLPAGPGEDFPLVDATFVAFAVAASLLLLLRRPPLSPEAFAAETVVYTDPRWRAGWGHVLVWAAAPVLLLIITGLSLAMQTAPAENSRLRFGPQAYWREALQVMGTWRVTGMASEPGGMPTAAPDVPFSTVEFTRDRKAVLTLATGGADDGSHGWHHADSVIWLDWLAGEPGNPDAESIPMQLKDQRIYIPWPPKGKGGTYLVMERISAMN